MTYTVSVFDGSQASWSPDGRRFAFARINVGGHKDSLWVMNVDGTNLRKIVDWGLYPKWLPCGTRILCGRMGRITIVNSDKTYLDDRELVHLSSKSVTGDNFRLSPDGRMVAFIEDGIENREHFTALHVVDIDGSNSRCLVKDNRRRRSLSWSSNSQWLVCGHDYIQVFNVEDGSSEILQAYGSYVTWSPVSDEIAFYIHPSSEYFKGVDPPHLENGIYVLDFNTRESKKLKAFSVVNCDLPLVWSPNGEFLVFEQEEKILLRKSKNTIGLLQVKNSRIFNLIEETQGADSSISWSQDSTKIAVCLARDFSTHIIDVQKHIYA